MLNETNKECRDQKIDERTQNIAGIKSKPWDAADDDESYGYCYGMQLVGHTVKKYALY